MGEVLTRELAEKRANQIENVSYILSLNLEKEDKEYTGRCTINFGLKHTKEPLMIDFIGKIKKLTLNGKEKTYNQIDNKISISPEHLNPGENTIKVEYQNKYDTTGEGLHHFTDPEDKNEYIYAHFEPYTAHRMFPCFDQPDLKATMELTVASPKEWELIANTLVKETKEKNQRKTVTFNKTKPISTYLFHLSAGPYVYFEDKWNNVPLRIYCRKAIKQHIREKEFFTITKQGLDFYTKFFGFDYPFEKYDQLFVPEFNMGAMENVGAVTFTERLAFRHAPTRAERIVLANVILHEMVHMWFGDLVTMKWWDDLWLNESFADYLSYFGMVRATEYKEGMQDFSSRKSWAFVQDQLPTTHPVAANASDTDVAFSNFDGISYAKGASIIKQLIFYLGEETFSKAVQVYFKKHQWGNTVFDDFLTSMEDTSGKNLKDWARLWIQTSGINRVEPIYEIKEDRITKFSIKQSPGGNILRPHKTKVALFYRKDKKCEKQKEVELSFNEAETPVKELIGERKPDFVCLDYSDDCYFKEKLDKGSLEYALSKYEELKDGLTRQVLLRSLWHMVRDAELQPKKFLDFILEKSLLEANQVNLERMFMNVYRTLRVYLNGEDYKEYCQKFYDLGFKTLEKSAKDNRNTWFRLIALSSFGVKDTSQLIDLFEEKIKIDDFKLNPEQRWAIILTLAIHGHKRFNELLEKEKKIDPSDKGIKSAFRAESSHLKNKENVWKEFIEEKKSTDFLREGMRGFFWKSQREELEKYSDEFFKVILEIFKDKDKRYAETFFELLQPELYPDSETIRKSEELLKIEEIPFLLRKNLLELIDEVKRTRKILEIN